jgi:hypothetical protein
MLAQTVQMCQSQEVLDWERRGHASRACRKSWPIGIEMDAHPDLVAMRPQAEECGFKLSTPDRRSVRAAVANSVLEGLPADTGWDRATYRVRGP